MKIVEITPFTVLLADGSEEVVLTPVRRSIRKTPQKRSALKNTPVVTTPQIISENRHLDIHTSPGLRLTPDNASLSNELAIIGTGIEAGETREDATCSETREEDAGGPGMDLELKENEMDCDLEQQAPVVLKSACKSTNSISRKTPRSKVTFQSPAELEDQQRTPECGTGNEAATPVSLPQVNDFGKPLIC